MAMALVINKKAHLESIDSGRCPSPATRWIGHVLRAIFDVRTGKVLTVPVFRTPTLQAVETVRLFAGALSHDRTELHRKDLVSESVGQILQCIQVSIVFTLAENVSRVTISDFVVNLVPVRTRIWELRMQRRFVTRTLLVVWRKVGLVTGAIGPEDEVLNWWRLLAESVLAVIAIYGIRERRACKPLYLLNEKYFRFLIGA
jgi:hypothetical protein